MQKSERSHLPFLAQGAIQRLAVPFSQVGRSFIGALQKLKKRRVRLTRSPHRVVGQQELAELLAEKRLLRQHARGTESLRRWIGVGIEGRVVDWTAAARPEAGARDARNEPEVTRLSGRASEVPAGRYRSARASGSSSSGDR